MKTAWFSPLAVIRYLQQPMVNNKFTKFTQLMLRELWHLTFLKSTRKKLYSKRRFASPFSPTVEGFIRFRHKQNNNFMFSLNPERNATLNRSNTLVDLLSFSCALVVHRHVWSLGRAPEFHKHLILYSISKWMRLFFWFISFHHLIPLPYLYLARPFDH